MAFSLYVGAEIMGKKDNVIVDFPGRPSLREMTNVIQNALSQECRGHVMIDQVRIYDEVLGKWVDLVREEQLHSGAQVYAFQPDSYEHRDMRGVIPAPRRLGQPAASPSFQNYQTHYPPTPPSRPYLLEGNSPSQHSPMQMSYVRQPEAGLPGVDPVQAEKDRVKEQERHQLIAQHLSGQIGQGERMGGVTAMSPPQNYVVTPPHPSAMQMHPAQSPIMPSPVHVMPPMSSPVTGGVPPPASPMTPLPGTDGIDPRQAEIDRRKEEERHRLIAEHLRNNIGQGQGQGQGQSYVPQPAPTGSPYRGGLPPGSPFAGSPYHAGPQGVTSPHVLAPPPPSPMVVDPSFEKDKEAERHALIAQHLRENIGR
eukprot:TRINITY_DN10580_c0_g1_i1.p1 TRINITY_DN10580_c0_g1~~TRINITY_DN10580_c0_g1_i1.p1  ORF type:complete len:388 (+),score=65.51 TRINITY_DN10580_c0_g1_i1:64-1164(+)